jgi:hypothetical protein
MSSLISNPTHSFLSILLYMDIVDEYEALSVVKFVLQLLYNSQTIVVLHFIHLLFLLLSHIELLNYDFGKSGSNRKVEFLINCLQLLNKQKEVVGVVCLYVRF